MSSINKLKPNIDEKKVKSGASGQKRTREEVDASSYAKIIDGGKKEKKRSFLESIKEIKWIEEEFPSSASVAEMERKGAEVREKNLSVEDLNRFLEGLSVSVYLLMIIHSVIYSYDPKLISEIFNSVMLFSTFGEFRETVDAVFGESGVAPEWKLTDVAGYFLSLLHAPGRVRSAFKQRSQDSLRKRVKLPEKAKKLIDDVNRVKAFVNKSKRSINDVKEAATKVYKKALADHRKAMAEYDEIEKFIREVDDVRSGTFTSNERAAHISTYRSNESLKSKFTESQYLLVVAKIKGEKDLDNKDSALRGSNVFNDYLRKAAPMGAEMETVFDEDEEDGIKTSAENLGEVIANAF